jgi:hypothetical protein
MLVEVHDTVTWPVEETGFAELLTELHANSVSNAEVLHRLDERSHRQTEEASGKRWRRLWHRQVS